MTDNLLISRRIFLAAPVVLAACKPDLSVLTLAGTTMGTTYSVTARDASGRLSESDLRAAIETALAQVNGQMSNWEPHSEISRVNQMPEDAAVSLSPSLARVLTVADEIHGATDGKFDLTTGPLIELWGFGAGAETPHRPTDAAIAAALEVTGQRRMLQLDEDRLSKTAGAGIFLPAIGKGYGVDQMAAALNGLGITDYMVEIGGDLATRGQNPNGTRWQIGVETPSAFERGLNRVLGLTDQAVATSGDYRNYFEEDGTRYSHILDATTGRPITHRTASVSVAAASTMEADAWATALLVLGRERGLELAHKRGMAALFIERDRVGGENRFTATASDAFAALEA